MLNIVYLCPKEQFLTKVSRVRFHQIKAIGKLANVVWSGKGWENYHNFLSVQHNLAKIYSGIMPDLVVVFDHRELIDFEKLEVPKCIMMNEMHAPDGSRDSALEILKKYDLIICHHLNEMMNPFFDNVRNRLYNIPHCAEKTIFKDYGFNKSVDILLCGSLFLEKYKLRKRFIETIENMNRIGYKCKIHKHPGGYLSDAHTDRYLIDFAKTVNSSKICLSCSSIYKCSFGKYIEIPLCHSLLAGDIPDERQDFFSSFMLVINPEESQEIIMNKLKYYLDNDEERENLINRGYKMNQDYTMEYYAQRFIDKVNIFLSKRKVYL